VLADGLALKDQVVAQRSPVLARVALGVLSERSDAVGVESEEVVPLAGPPVVMALEPVLSHFDHLGQTPLLHGVDRVDVAIQLVVAPLLLPKRFQHLDLLVPGQVRYAADLRLLSLGLLIAIN